MDKYLTIILTVVAVCVIGVVLFFLDCAVHYWLAKRRGKGIELWMRDKEDK